KIICISFLCFGFFLARAQQYNRIVINKTAHPAVKSAAHILAKKLAIPVSHIIEKDKIKTPTKGEIALTYGTPSKSQLKFIEKDHREVESDGYLIKFKRNSALIFAKRPRSLLYAAGDLDLWKKEQSGIYIRQPDFKIRDINKGAVKNIATLIANSGANI